MVLSLWGKVAWLRTNEISPISFVPESWAEHNIEPTVEIYVDIYQL